jgi:hypothetical protein
MTALAARSGGQPNRGGTLVDGAASFASSRPLPN